MLPLSIVVPTIGRVKLLEQCLRSILACTPGAQELVVVDQSDGGEVDELIRSLGSPEVRRIECPGRGIALAMNIGLAAATNEVVLVTHDDCAVPDGWVQVGWNMAQEYPDAIVTGRVLPPDGSQYVPSTKTDTTSEDFSGRITSGALYPANMVVPRAEIQAIGGFDERPSFRVAAEDNDLCYRWLVAGRRLRYEPDLFVWHHDWRSPEQLLRTHAGYARAQGAFYAKHLHARDKRVLSMLRWDLRHGLRSSVIGRLRGTPRWQDPYREMVRWLPVGLVAGWREARSLRRDVPTAGEGNGTVPGPHRR